MKPTTIILLLCINTTSLLAQLKVANDSIQIRVIMPEINVSKISDLNLKFQVKNLTKRRLPVYEVWEEGPYGDKMSNCSFDILMLENGKYVPFYIRYVHYDNTVYTSEIYRHYNPLMTELPINSCKEFNFNILNLTESFPPGKYKFRIHFRINTIANLENFSKEDFELGLLQPLDKIVYLTTNWQSFKVSKFISF